MKQKISQQMCSNYTLYAAVQTDFYLRQNELTAFPEVDNKWNQENVIVFYANPALLKNLEEKLPWRWMTNESLWLQR